VRTFCTSSRQTHTLYSAFRWKGFVSFSAILILSLLLSMASPLAAENPNGVAVIIGNKTYLDQIPSVDYAHRDAEAIRRYITDILGYNSDNIIYLLDATKAQIEATFGNERGFKGKLWRYLEQEGNSDITVFYSGHGVPGQRDGHGYLLPVDADPDQAEINGFPIDLLYKNLQKLKARSKTVLLDACFSGNSPKGMLIRSASPIFLQSKPALVGEGITVLTAASGNQLASWDEKAQHGLFTEYLLRGVYGEADKDKNNLVTLNELKGFLDRNMTKAARREYGREQTPTVLGDGQRVIAKLSLSEAIARPKFSRLPEVQGNGSESEFWASVKDSKNPNELEAYLKKYPNGTFAPLARLKLKHAKKYENTKETRLEGIEEKLRKLQRDKAEPSEMPKSSRSSNQFTVYPDTVQTIEQDRGRQALDRLQRQLNDQSNQPKSLKELIQ